MNKSRVQLKTRTNSLLPVVVLFCLFLIFTGYHGYAQITIDQSDMPAPGDTIRKSTVLNFNQFDFELTGEDYNWDFSGLQPISQSVDTFVKVTDTPIVYWPFFLLVSNMASPAGNSPFEQLPLTDIFNFYNNSSGDFRDVGFASTVYGVPLPFKFDNPDILYDFPLNYGNTYASQSGFQFAIPDIGYILVDRNRSNTVDGWGTMTTPFGSFDVLRLKSEVQEYDSLYLDSLNFGIPVNLVYTEYKWLAKGQKIPLLKVTQNMLGVVVEYVDSVRDLTVGIHNNKQINNSLFHVYPNPARDQVTLQFEPATSFPVFVCIYNLTGERLYRKEILRHQETERISLAKINLDPGAYVIRCEAGGRNFSKTLIYAP